MTPEIFADAINESFTTLSSDGKKMVELKKNGRNIPVTWHNRKEYTALLRNYYLTEFSEAVVHIQHGLSKICPVDGLELFSWEELEFRVCGNSGLDLPTLKANTIYKFPLSEDTPVVIHFWEVLSSFTCEEQILFLQYVNEKGKGTGIGIGIAIGKGKAILMTIITRQVCMGPIKTPHHFWRHEVPNTTNGDLAKGLFYGTKATKL
jgi:hypothetical protein